MKLFVAGATAMCASALTGCASSDNAPWTATYDESLGLLAAEPNEDAILGRCSCNSQRARFPFLPSNPPACKAATYACPWRRATGQPPWTFACISLFSRRRRALMQAPSNPSRLSSTVKNARQSGPKDASSKPVHNNVGSVRLIQPRTCVSRIRQRKTQVRASLPGIRAFKHILPCFGKDPRWKQCIEKIQESLQIILIALFESPSKINLLPFRAFALPVT